MHSRDDISNIENEADLESSLSRPTAGVLETLRSVPGDVMVLGAGGKMGPTLARMLKRACDQLSDSREIYAVSRFSSADIVSQLRSFGVVPISCDLTDRTAVDRLPDSANIIYMAGQKFGTSDKPELTWVMNTLVPGIIAARYSKSRIVVFSTGCVYPFVDRTGAGSTESDPLDPPGEYANSCVGRERIFSYFSQQNRTPILIFRLNYAIDLRYGVLLDVAQKVLHGQPVDVTMGWANIIWQGDANARAIQSLALTSTPPAILNVTGAEHVSIRHLAQQFGAEFEKEAIISGTEAPTALLSDASKSIGLFGPPAVTLEDMILATAIWLKMGGRSLGKPTHFETRDGQF